MDITSLSYNLTNQCQYPLPYCKNKIAGYSLIKIDEKNVKKTHAHTTLTQNKEGLYKRKRLIFPINIK